MTVSDVAELSNVTKSAAPADDKRKSIFQRLSSVGRMVADGLEVESDSDNYEEDAPRPPNEFKSIKPMRMKSMIAKSSGAMNTSMNSSEIFMSTIYENLDEWEEPELQNEYQEAVRTRDRGKDERVDSDSKGKLCFVLTLLFHCYLLFQLV